MDFQRSLIFSCSLHFALLLAAWIGLPSARPHSTEPIFSIPVDLIDVSNDPMMKGEKDGEKSDVAERRAVEKPPEKPDDIVPDVKKPPVDPSSADSVPPPPPKQDEIKKEPEPKPQEKPEELDPEALAKKIEQAKKEEARKKEEQKKLEEKKKLAEQKRKEEQKRLEQAKQFDANKISDLLNRQDGAPRQAGEVGKPNNKASLGNPNGTGKRLTQSELALLVGMIRDQIAPCWSPPISATASDDLVILIDIEMNPDGSINGKPQIANNSSNPAFRANADAAVRAILRCSPLRLPADKYEHWKNITYNFTPKAF